MLEKTKRLYDDLGRVLGQRCKRDGTQILYDADGPYCPTCIENSKVRCFSEEFDEWWRNPEEVSYE